MQAQLMGHLNVHYDPDGTCLLCVLAQLLLRRFDGSLYGHRLNFASRISRQFFDVIERDVVVFTIGPDRKPAGIAPIILAM